MQATKNFVFSIFKVLLVIALLGSIINFLFVERDFTSLIREVRLDYSLNGWICLVLAILMVIPNWLIEAYKWKIGMDSYAVISLKDSFVSVMSGITLGLMTPARVGEYAGRMIKVSKERYGQTIVATFLSSLSQLLVTLMIGGLSFALVFRQFDFEGLSYELIMYLATTVFAILLLSFLNLSKVISLVTKIEWVASKMEGLVGIEFRWQVQLEMMMLAALRFLVYSFQYILILRFCGVDALWWLLFCHISMIFFLQSLLPLPPVASFFARTGVALIILSNLEINEVVNVLSSMVIWVINLSIPALVGLYFILIRKTESV